MNPFWMVGADLRRNFAAGLGSFLLLAFAFSVSVASGLLARGLEGSAARAADDYDLVVGAPGSRLDLVMAAVFLRADDPLPLLDSAAVDALAADPRVKASSPLVLADNYRGFPVVGVGRAFPELRPSLRLAAGAWPAGPFQAAVGSAVPLGTGAVFETSHGEAGHAAGTDPDGAPASAGGHEHKDYTVSGRLAPTGTPWDRAVIVPIEGIWSIHGKAEAGAGAVLVKPKNFAAAYALRAAYRSGATTAAFPGEVLASAFGFLDGAKKGVGILALLLQGLVLAAVLLSLLASLPSKYRWIGLLRSLGAGRLYVFLTLWLQSAVVFLLAGLAGLGLGLLGAQLLASAAGSGTGLRLDLSLSPADLLPLAEFWLLGLLGSLVPAVAGFRVSPRKAVLGR